MCFLTEMLLLQIRFPLCMIAESDSECHEIFRMMKLKMNQTDTLQMNIFGYRETETEELS